ncbi:ArnT family glycosyltransferase [Flagellimonas zhangzhouensis]|uniref:4-amino-4-deoxy-L-arabinose transferase n=1 Tax=Flagellimonas zhangzhouensis TaxID=1073328 RepID=A0A1H2VFK4_9FLAO|nr:glycosyltransferase family 39 protein [Allomuricauda zhangzhouensis]SDQ08197.1 4-amino-4-deoxy-L-arabinose transferase [Allomuricauda zhangzhouensis]SDW67098.1 4-amino-4-deoxy-L-arabinose transferase [Allomuricauda zhangzhouensis]
MSQKFPKLFLILLAILFVLNLIQASFTELIYDEAYYWYYAQNMAWGYFDHPPMVAFLIKISSLFFNGELGVRFMSCVLSAGTYMLLWLLIDNPKKKDYVVHFFLLTFSFTLMNAYGFLTLPDTPLLFFTALFLWLYKQFLKNPSIVITLSLGVVMAALMYSKYHAVLVILTVFLSNFKLIYNKKAWNAVVLALLCYAPHFWWLYQNDFASITFHLYERPNQEYKFDSFTLGYFLNLIVIIGLLFFWIYSALFKFKAKDKFSKALVYLIYGVLIFFFISSFNRRVQAQWTIAISIPLILIAYNRLLNHANTRKWVFRIGLISAVVLLYARAWMIYQPLFPFIYETHGNKTWVNELHEQTGDTPIVFENSYRRAPMYQFYTGVTTFSLNNFMYRKNQYSIDGSEEKVRGKEVVYVSIYSKFEDAKFKHADGTEGYGKYIDNFQSYRNIKCIVEKPNEGVGYLLKVYNPYPFDIELSDLKYTISYSNPYKQVQEMLPLKVKKAPNEPSILKSKDTLNYTFELPLSKMENPSYFRVGISEHGLPPGLNGRPIKIEE